MQDAVAAARDQTSLRVGDLAWLSRVHTHRELALDIRLWEDETGGLIAWTFYRANGEFNMFVTPGHVAHDLVDELIDTVEDAAAGSVSSGDPVVELHTYGIVGSRSAEDRALEEALHRRGYEADGSLGGLLCRTLDALPEAPLPPGYRLTHVQTEDELAGRVEAHRAAFAPSALTLVQYERVRRTWPYRPKLDRIVVTDDGTVAAFCTAWFDAANAAGLLEPVGTHPSHRRLGLASAVCLDALRVLRQEGATIAEVGYVTDAALALYRGIGFQPGFSDPVMRRRR